MDIRPAPTHLVLAKTMAESHAAALGGDAVLLDMDLDLEQEVSVPACYSLVGTDRSNGTLLDCHCHCHAAPPPELLLPCLGS